MLALLRYTSLRLALFVLSFLALTLVGLNGVYAAIGAILLSAVLSLFLLRSQRDALALKVAERQQKWSKRINDATTKEDFDNK